MKRIDELYRLIEDVTGHSPVANVAGSGGGSKKGSGGSASTAPDTLFSTATVRIVDMLGEGEIVGVVGGLQGIYLNDIPVQNADGSYNFKGFSADFRVGAPDQSYMPGYPDVQNPQNIGVKVNQPTPVSASITGPAADRARVTIQLPALFLAKNDGSMSNNTVVYRIEARYNGGPWVNPIGDQTITGKTTSGYFRSHEINLPKNPNGTSAPWTVRVTRLSPDTDGFNNSQTKYTNQSDTVFYSLTTIIDAKFSYPHTAYVGITAQASSFGSTVPVRKYLVDGQELSVPSNYDPVARTYSGIWDGTFKTAYSNNPAWALYLLLQNDRFGLGEYVDASAIDKWSLYEIGRYCDQLVSDGKGGKEPRSTFNGVIETQQEAFELLQIVAQVFRGLVYWSSGSVTAAQDRPRDPMFLATESNVIDGVFTYSSSSYKARHTVAVVRFQDPDNLYKVDYEVVEDEEGIARYGYNPTRIDLLGCTSRGQAHRAGSWILLTELQQTQALNYKAGLDHATARPGDVVAVLDPSVVTLDASGNLGGRLLFGSTATILNLDHPVILDGSTYSASVQMIDGTIATADVVNGAGTYSQIQLKNPLGIVPDAGAVWELAGPTKPRLFSIISAHESEPHIYDISLLQYEPSKYAAVDDGAKFEPTIFSQLGSKVDAPINLTVRESQYMELGQAKQALTLSWQPANPFNVTGYYVTAIRPSGAAINLSRTVSVSVDFIDVDPGDWIFLVTTVGLNGNASLPTQLTYTVKGWQGQDPTIVTNLQVLGGGSTFNGRACTLSWTNSIPATVTPYPVVNVVRVYDISTAVQLHYEVLPAGVTQWTYDYEINKNEGGPRRNFRVAVSARYASGSDGPPTSLAVSNPPPAKIAPDLSAVSETFFVNIKQPSDGDWAGYLIWYSDASGFNPLTTAPKLDTNNNLSVFPGTSGATYYVRAAAYDAFSNNPAELNISDEQSVKLTLLPIDTSAPTIPGTPTLTTAAETAADGTVSAVIRATWTASTGSNFGGVYSVGIAYPGGDYVFDRVNSAKWEMHNLPVNTAFQIKVRAEAANGLNASGYSPVASITTAKSTAIPANPTNVKAVATYQGVQLTWTPAVAKDVTSVEIWYADGTSTAAAPVTGAIKLSAASLSGFFVDPTVPVTGVRTYWLRSVSSSDVVAASYTTPVTATNPQIQGGQLSAGIIDATKFATSIAATTIVSTLPTTKTTPFVTLASDGKLYRWDSSANGGAGAYVSSVDVTSIDASKITGQLTDAQILGVAATKLTTQIQKTNIADNAVDTPQLNAGAVSTNKLAAYAVTASKLAISGANFFFNSEFSQTTKTNSTIPLGLSFASNGGVTVNYNAIRRDYCPIGFTAFAIGFPAAAVNGVADIYCGRVGPDNVSVNNYPVAGGVAYEISAFLSVLYGGSAYLFVSFYNSSNTNLGTFNSNTVNISQNGTEPRAWEANGGRAKVLATAPSGSTYCTITIRWNAPSSASSTGPYLFVSGPMFGPISAQQLAAGEASPYEASGVTTINGANLITGTITATQINATNIFGDSGVFNALVAGTASFGGLTAGAIAAGAITADKIGVGLSAGNMCWNSDYNGPNSAVLGYNEWAGILPAETNALRTDWAPAGMRCAFISTAGTPNNGQVSEIIYQTVAADGTFTSFVPVVPGQRYEMQYFSSNHRCDSCIYAAFYDINKAFTNAYGGVFTYSGLNNTATANLATFTRNADFFTVPTGVYYIRLVARARSNGAANPYLFATGWYLAKATANQNQFSTYSPQSATVISGGQVATGTLNASAIIAGTITTDRFTSNTIDANVLTTASLKTQVLATGALTADNITVGTGTLTSVFGGTNTTKINGGAIQANSISAQQLFIGQRGIVFTNVEFYQERDGNGVITGRLCWTSGRVDYIDATGGRSAATISAGGTAGRGSDSWQTVWWNINTPTVLQYTPNTAGQAGFNVTNVLNDTSTVLCATSADSTGVSVYFGGSRVDGTKITALSIQAAQIAAGQIQTQHMTAGTINGDRISAGSLTADTISGGTITANTVYIGNTNFYLQNFNGPRMAVFDGTRARVVIGNLSTVGYNDYSLAVWDAAGNLMMGPSGLRTASLNGTVAGSQIGAGTGGKNLLTNATFNLGTLGINASTSNGAYPIAGAGIDISGGTYSLNSGHTMTMALNGSPGSDTYMDLDFRGTDNRNFACYPGQRIEMYAYVNSHRSTRQVFLCFCDGGGNLLAAPSVGPYPSRDTGGSDLGGYDQFGAIVNVPNNCFQMYLKVRAIGTGQANPYLFVTRPYIGLALPNQTEFSPWNSVGQASMNADTVSYYMASATIGDAQIGTLSAGKISVGSLSAFTANAGTITAGLLQSADGLMQVDLSNKRILIGQ